MDCAGCGCCRCSWCCSCDCGVLPAEGKTIGDQLDYDASVYYDDEDGLAETDEAAQDGEFSEDKPEEK